MRGAVVSADPELRSCARVVRHSSIVFEAKAAARARDKDNMVIRADRYCHRGIGTLGTIVIVSPHAAPGRCLITLRCIIGRTETFTKSGNKHTSTIVAYSDGLTHIEVITRTRKACLPKWSHCRRCRANSIYRG